MTYTVSGGTLNSVYHTECSMALNRQVSSSQGSDMTTNMVLYKYIIVVIIGAVVVHVTTYDAILTDHVYIGLSK